MIQVSNKRRLGRSSGAAAARAPLFRLSLALLLLLALVLSGCSDQANSGPPVPEGKNEISGYVVKRDKNRFLLTSYSSGQGRGTEALWIRFKGDVPLGGRVAVELEGDIRTSYPGMGQAKSARLLDSSATAGSARPESSAVAEALARHAGLRVPVIKETRLDQASGQWAVILFDDDASPRRERTARVKGLDWGFSSREDSTLFTGYVVRKVGGRYLLTAYNGAPSSGRAEALLIHTGKSLRPGQLVEAFVSGGIDESYPAQGKAEDVQAIETDRPSGAFLLPEQAVARALERRLDPPLSVPAVKDIRYEAGTKSWTILLMDSMAEDDGESTIEVADQ
ncbi:hypothetical protein [Paenibacillus sp. P22]|uniref:hypothetical protein n=1 Tax=Paenibacillus TaxID=44249 RepID=UPI00038F584A|nr:hypothetical protein [Paenibacillus sp. P22]CDN43023.1 hypothetical protein BN871_CJ_00210 [Paenibacillus sp. P22]